jgi:hypothetical protein
VKVLWTLVKIALAAALVIPVGIIVLATALGLLGALFGIAVFTLRIAVVGLIVYGLVKLVGALMRGPAPAARPREIAAPAPRDPYYEAAMRELDQDVGTVR